MTSIFKQLDYHIYQQPEKIVYCFLDINGLPKEQYTYQDFHLRTSIIARSLQREFKLKDRARILLAYPPGLEMICAFFASSRIGLIPVPVYPPSGHALLTDFYKIEHIARDCGASAILTNKNYHESLKLNKEEKNEKKIVWQNSYVSKLQWINTNDLGQSGDHEFCERHSDILFLQYTSGSTSKPRGVIVCHKNILHNGSLIDDDTAIGVSWLPQYHDMGLIGYYLFSALKGGTTYGFSSLDFMLRPSLWLETITKYKATASSAPNFAYDYCLSPGKIPQETYQKIDLSSLKFLMTAAEPVRPETYCRFLKAFEPYGLKTKTYIAAYGLAENTLAVSSYGRNILTVDKNSLKCNKLKILAPDFENSSATRIMSCGKPLESISVKIVHPEKHFELNEGDIGEVWINGDSKCDGYWGKPGLSKKIFKAKIQGSGCDSNEYLRTGDIGFLYEKELYVCGREKDMVIIRGLNHYPQDIEMIVEESSELIRKGAVAAFSVDKNEEKLIIVAGLKNRKNIPDPEKISGVLVKNLNIQPHSIVFVAAGDIPKTSSGKIIRYHAKQKWEKRDFDILYEYIPPSLNREVNNSLNVKSHWEILKIKYGLAGNEQYTLLDADIDSLDLAILIHDIEEILKNKGASKITNEIDFKLIQQIKISELFSLAHQIEDPSEAVMENIKNILLRLQNEYASIEKNAMMQDIKLVFKPKKQLNYKLKPESNNILLTGGTGFFGSFILKSLLLRSNKKIYVIVRAKNSQEAKERLLNALKTIENFSTPIKALFDEQVVAICGDLSQPFLGLDKKTWISIANNISSIYHNGAMVNYLFNYEKMRPVNVIGTNEILKLAFEGIPKILNHISTTFTFGWALKDILYERDSNIDLNLLDFGYSQTKWVSEELVKDAMSYGLRARIFRPALITPSLEGGGYNFDVSIRLLSFMIKHGIGVDANNQVSFTPADVAANNIVAISQMPETVNKTFHVTRDKYNNMLDITDIITRQTGKRFKIFKLAKFVPEVIQRCTRKDLLFPLLNFLVRSVDNISSMEFKRYDSSNYQNARNNSIYGTQDPTLEETVRGLLLFMQKNRIININLGTVIK
jgi:thioester reductase-like protein